MNHRIRFGALAFLLLFALLMLPSPARASGEIVGWGWNYYGQCNVPSPNAGFVAVAARGGLLPGNTFRQLDPRVAASDAQSARRG